MALPETIAELGEALQNVWETGDFNWKGTAGVTGVDSVLALGESKLKADFTKPQQAFVKRYTGPQTDFRRNKAEEKELDQLVKDVRLWWKGPVTKRQHRHNRRRQKAHKAFNKLLGIGLPKTTGGSSKLLKAIARIHSRMPAVRKYMKGRQGLPKAVQYHRPNGTLVHKSPVVAGVTRTGGAFSKFSGKQGERKYWDVSNGSAGGTAGGDGVFLIGNPTNRDTTTFCMQNLLFMEQGTGAQQRIGRVIWVKKLHLRGDITWQPGNSDECIVRMLVYCDSQANGANPAATDILANTSTSNAAPGDGVITVRSMLKLENSDRFRILKDKIFVLNRPSLGYEHDGGTTENNLRVTRQIKYDFNMNKDVHFKTGSTGGSVDDIKSNNIGVLFVVSFNDVSGGATGTVNALISGRVRYTD